MLSTVFSILQAVLISRLTWTLEPSGERYRLKVRIHKVCSVDGDIHKVCSVDGDCDIVIVFRCRMLWSNAPE